jgi:hypothetical protein
LSSYDENEDAPVYNSSTSKFEISGHDQLIYLSENFADAVTGVSGVSGDWREQDFVLTQPLNLDGCDFTPIGGNPSDGTPFTGSFDGQGNRILGLVAEGTDSQGLFGNVVGTSGDKVEISNLQLFVDSVSATGGSALAGAVAGLATHAVFSRISTTGSVETDGNQAGGLVGQATSSSFDYVRSGVNVTNTSAGGKAGGIAGVANAVTVSNSYALGNISGKEGGGLVGLMSGDLDITNSYAVGTVSYNDSLEGDTLGGLLGVVFDENFTITSQNSFWDTDRTGQSSSAGVPDTGGKTSAEMTSTATFSAWNGANGLLSWVPFDASTDTIWGMCSGVNDGYPFLLWEYTTDPCVSDDSGDSSSANSSNTNLEGASSAGIHLDAGIQVGNPHSELSILAEGEGLARGQAFTVTLNPGGQVLTSGTASRLGYFSTNTTLPTGLTPGTYTLTLNTKDPAGNPLVLTERFGIDASGLFTAPSPTAASNAGTGATSAEATPAAETSGEATEAPTTSADPDTSDPTEAATTTQGSDDNTTPVGNSNTDSSTNSSPEGTSDPIPGWLVITASSILITLVLGGVGIGIYRARQSRAW